MAKTATNNSNQVDEDSKIFPQKLMDILEDPSNKDAITWHPNGKCFIIVDRRKFCKHVLPKYFRKSKYTSFTRKLNRWNFARLTRGRQVSTYYHEYFQRGKASLCTQMYCNNDRAKFAVASKTNKPEVSASKSADVSSTSKPNLANIYAQVLPFDHQHSSDSIARTVEADLHRRALLMQQQNNLLVKKDLISSAVAGKSGDLNQLALSDNSPEALLRRQALVRQHQVLEQEAIRLRLQLSMMQQQRCAGQKSGFNFCSAA